MKKLFLLLFTVPSFISAMNLEMNGKTTFKYSKHSLERLEERNIQKDEIRLAVRQGKVYHCTEPDTYVCNTSDNIQVLMSYNTKRNEVTIITAYKAVNGKFPQNILTNHLSKKSLHNSSQKEKNQTLQRKIKMLLDKSSLIIYKIDQSSICSNK
ncbi:DUF4258 domain-containing protein [Vermiphilus pyriformis]|nr:MAG: DUF4258 domain-containing protein [Vermiphilus pyriformis]